jgi:hypothetical protein
MSAFKKQGRRFLLISIRTFLGVGDFFDSSLFKTFIEGWFKQFEWTILTAALFVVGFKIPNSGSNLFFLLRYSQWVLYVIVLSYGLG